MVRNSKSWRAASLAIAVLVMAGCGTMAAQQVPQGPSMQQGPDMQGQDPLNLTQEQIQRLQNFMQRQAAQEQPGAVRARLQRFQHIVLAPQVDVVALAQHLEEDRARMRARIAQTVAYWQELRDTLTPEQTATLVQLITTQPAPGPAPEPPSQLGLTEAQKQALKSLQSPEADQAIQQAIIAFLQQGDSGVLASAMEQAQALMPSSAQVAQVLAGLSLQQRQALFTAPPEQQQQPSMSY